MAGDPTSRTSITAKYTGPCPAGMQAGDIVLANGMKMNMKGAAANAQEMAKNLSKNGAPQLGSMKGAELAKAMAAAQAEIDPEDLKAMQEAMQEMGKMAK